MKNYYNYHLPYYVLAAKPERKYHSIRNSNRFYILITISITSLIWGVWIFASQNGRVHGVITKVEIIDKRTSSGILIDSESYGSDKSSLATVIASENKVIQGIRGYTLISTTDSPYIYPDLAQQLDFKTSQLVIFNGRAFPSRKILYLSQSAPRVVIVTELDANVRPEILHLILEERLKFAKANGYGLFMRYIQDFAAEGRPLKESLGVAHLRLLRQAMLVFPRSSWFWYYGTRGHIQSFKTPILPLMNDKTGSLQFALDTRYEDINIHSFATDAKGVDIVLSIDPNFPEIVSASSIMLRRSLAAMIFLELLIDPVVQDFEGFSSARDHAGEALTHILRWHPQIRKYIGMVSPEWSGNQMCTDSFDRRMPCMFNSLSDWLYKK